MLTFKVFIFDKWVEGLLEMSSGNLCFYHRNCANYEKLYHTGELHRMPRS